MTDCPDSLNLSRLDLQALYESDDLSWLEVTDAQIEGTFVERKERCTSEAIARQISAFANGQPPGGLLVVGVTSKGEIVGIGADKGKLERALGATNSQVDSIGWKYRWVTSSGREVLLCFIPFSSDRVICLAGGRAFQRKGESTIELDPDEIAELRYARGERSFESEPVSPFSEELLDKRQASAFLDGVIRRNGLVLPATLEEALTNKSLLNQPSRALNVAGLLAIGRAPADYIPGGRLRFLRFEGLHEGFGTQRNVTKDAWFDGPIPTIIADFRSFLKGVVREFDYLGPEGKFVREPEYPEFALDEAIVNALVHRSYSLKNVAVFVRMFDDRIEVESPGGFPRNARPDPEGVFPFSAPRNPKLAQALQYLDLVRLAREGTRRMHDEMAALGLPPPRFAEEGGVKVVVTLFNDLDRRRSRLGTGEANRRWAEVLHYLPSDLAIERRQAFSVWEDLARRGASAPGDVLKSAVDLIRSANVVGQEKIRILNLIQIQTGDSLNLAATHLLRTLLSGQVGTWDDQVSSQVAAILGRVDDAVTHIIHAIESDDPVVIGSHKSLNIAFQALWTRLHRDQLPPRQWLERVARLAEANKSSNAATLLFSEITGRQPSQ